jgi:hypothetical protein
MGHTRIAGRVTEQALGGSALIRVDVPALPARGGIPAQPAFTRYFGIAAVYSLTPVSEAIATQAADSMRVRPVDVYMAAPQLRAGPEWGDETCEENENNHEVNDLHYGPFTATVTWDEDAQIYHGEVINIKDVITFQSETKAGLAQAMWDSIHDYLEFRDISGLK